VDRRPALPLAEPGGDLGAELLVLGVDLQARTAEGRPEARAIPLAMFSPTNSDPANPGPRVTATASMAYRPTWLCESAWETTPWIASMCIREATSG
jgi:hypothetical protein